MREQSCGIRPMSRLEVNVRRLLEKCELMAKEDVCGNWKLEKVPDNFLFIKLTKSM